MPLSDAPVMPSSKERKADRERERRAAAAAAAGRPVGINGRPREDAVNDKSGSGVSIMSAHIEEGTTSSKQEQWAATRNANKRAKRRLGASKPLESVAASVSDPDATGHAFDVLAAARMDPQTNLSSSGICSGVQPTTRGRQGSPMCGQRASILPELNSGM